MARAGKNLKLLGVPRRLSVCILLGQFDRVSIEFRERNQFPLVSLNCFLVFVASQCGFR